MNFTFTGFLPGRAPRPTAWAATQGCPYDGTTPDLHGNGTAPAAHGRAMTQ